MVPAGRTSRRQDAAILTFTRTQALTERLKQLTASEALHLDASTPFETSNQMCAIDSVEAIFIEINGPTVIDESLDLVKKIRRVSHAVNIFMLFTHAKSFSGVKYYLAGADHCIKLPNDQAEKTNLLSTIFHDSMWKEKIKLILDRTRLLLHADTNKIEISYTEMTILDALLKAPQHVMSQESIAKALNPDVVFYDPRALEKTISRLRTKIRAAYNIELIYSVRSFGYRMRRGIIS
ncbi:winged helix-turn-helix domain-containing protein [Pseudomonas agarici]|nr:winged helix-turn-helix domain-containing protein [Pseudomonas agarici]NWC11285.1 winged helix-turn-helix domain-containing protein [Pseudomonas agarici]SEL44480.1 DNA-binding response regulator, OmpR family, contains REC and winged-helix (wHTH) domain [Pseudomonas agarici]